MILIGWEMWDSYSGVDAFQWVNDFQRFEAS